MPNKIYEQIAGAPMLYHTIARAAEAECVDEVIVASPHPLPELPIGTREFVHTGPERDVLARYAQCLYANPADYVVRLTSDCPLHDPAMIDTVISWATFLKADYASNLLPSTFPDGFDIEVISKRLLKWLDVNVDDAKDREHVTLRFRRDPELQAQFRVFNLSALQDYSNLKLSVDTKEDLERVRAWEGGNGR